MNRFITMLLIVSCAGGYAAAQSAIGQLSSYGYSEGLSMPESAALRKAEAAYASERLPEAEAERSGFGSAYQGYSEDSMFVREPAAPVRPDNEMARRLAEVSLEKMDVPMHNKCYAGVMEAWGKVGIQEDPSLPGESAYQFAEWAEAYPDRLDKMGFMKLEPMPESFRDVPQGAVVVFDRGVCGHGWEHGHIEIVADQGNSRFGCSDGCRQLDGNKCLSYAEARDGGVNIYMPTGRGEGR